MPALIVCGAVAAFTLALSVFIFFYAFYSGGRKDPTYAVLRGGPYEPYRERALALIESAVKIPFEEVLISSYDGKRLYGRFYSGRDASPVHIQFNGYRGNGLRDFSGGLQMALARGDRVILVDQRSHGKSDGRVITFGIRERRDVVSWAEYAAERFGPGTKIILEGISMGAATVLMAADAGLPDAVAGIVADCPYSSPMKEISLVAGKMIRIPHLCDPFILIAGFIGGFNILSSDAVRSVKKTPVPVLLIHGKADDFVPTEMSREIYRANPSAVTLCEIENAPHGLSSIENRPAYVKALNDFLDKLLQADAPAGKD